MSRSSFTRYGLDTAPYSEDIEEMFRQRLEGTAMADDVIALSRRRVNDEFLARPLDENEKNAVNNGETLHGAREAVVFREQLASVAIRDQLEPLVSLQQIADENEFSWTFSQTPYHSACGEWAGRPRLFWVRRTIANRLASLSTELIGADFGVHFEDAFRPTGVQEGLFTRRYEMAKHEHPDWSHEELLIEAQSKTAFTPRFAAHKAGAAVDVRLRDLRDGTLLDIGHEYPEGGEVVRLDTPYVTQQQWHNRMLLHGVALRADLAMYPFEDWHLCAGDATAHTVDGITDIPAPYGPIKSFHEATGEITQTYNDDELDNTFSVSPGS